MRGAAERRSAAVVGIGERSVDAIDADFGTVLGMRVDATSYRRAARAIVRWARLGQRRYVCVACVNNVMEANERPEFMAAMNDSDLTVPDGRPLVWALSAQGLPTTQVRGANLTETLLEAARDAGLPVGILGGSPSALSSFRDRALERWPGLRIAFAVSPPFRDLTADEDRSLTREIQASGARLLLVALGCPKQELWMWRHRGAVPAVMVGVGAAIDFVAGTKRQAPVALQRAGLEWLFRLVTEPRRLWRRYLSQNPRFLAAFAAELVRSRRPNHVDHQGRYAA